MVGKLLAKGASINMQCKDGRTAMMMACLTGHESVVKALLGKGASMDVPNRHGAMALMLACEHGQGGGGAHAAGEGREHGCAR